VHHGRDIRRTALNRAAARLNGSSSTDVIGASSLQQMGQPTAPAINRGRSSRVAKPNFSVGFVRGFTVVELLVVIGIVAVLTGLLMPVLSHARAASGRVRCMSNLRQIGCGLIEYTERANDCLPRFNATANQQTAEWGEAMALTTRFGSRFDGLGLLLETLDITDPRLFYCPCHHGDHPYDRYASRLESRDIAASGTGPIYGNYHYRTHMDPAATSPIGTSLKGRNLSSIVLVVDGMRTRRDFNHVTGTNRLKGDGSVDWHLDHGNTIYKSLPFESVSSFMGNTIFQDAWRWIDARPPSEGGNDSGGSGGSQDD
jgi:type II secretory pathway pseudopilin PulG